MPGSQIPIPTLDRTSGFRSAVDSGVTDPASPVSSAARRVTGQNVIPLTAVIIPSSPRYTAGPRVTGTVFTVVTCDTGSVVKNGAVPGVKEGIMSITCDSFCERTAFPRAATAFRIVAESVQ